MCCEPPSTGRVLQCFGHGQALVGLLETEEFERAEQERIFKKYDQAPNAAHGMVDLAVGFELHGVCSNLGHRLQFHGAL